MGEAYITNIKSYLKGSYAPWRIPNKWNIKDWESWYALNKENLRFDKEKKEFYLTKEAVQLEKDPIKEFNKFLKILKNNSDRHINEDHLYYSIYFFEDVVGNNKFKVKPDESRRSPYSKYLKFLKNWLKENKDSLVWDKKKQSVRLK